MSIIRGINGRLETLEHRRADDADGIFLPMFPLTIPDAYRIKCEECGAEMVIFAAIGDRAMCACGRVWYCDCAHRFFTLIEDANEWRFVKRDEFTVLEELRLVRTPLESIV